MHSDPVIFTFVSGLFFIILLIILMRRLKQPHVVVYLIVGVLLGPHAMGLISDTETMARFGALGVILLLFFIGMEASPKQLAQNWSIAIFGTLLQIIVSVLAIAALGHFLSWSFSRVLLLGFVISLSSTAVVLKLLEDWQELNTEMGQNALGILLVQDLLIVPMLITLEFMGGVTPSMTSLVIQIVAGLLLLLLAIWLVRVEQIRIPWIRHMEKDREMQLFVSLGVCFGMAMITGSLGLSAPLGAFVAGMMVASAKQTHWVHQSLNSFRTIFIAAFFISVGMMIDMHFLYDYAFQVTLLVIAVILTNTLINAGIFRALSIPWGKSLYGGAILSQIGEFSFVLAALGFRVGLIHSEGYQMAISVISISLVVSPMWIEVVRRFSSSSKEQVVN